MVSPSFTHSHASSIVVIHIGNQVFLYILVSSDFAVQLFLLKSGFLLQLLNPLSNHKFSAIWDFDETQQQSFSCWVTGLIHPCLFSN